MIVSSETVPETASVVLAVSDQISDYRILLLIIDLVNDVISIVLATYNIPTERYRLAGQYWEGISN